MNVLQYCSPEVTTRLIDKAIRTGNKKYLEKMLEWYHINPSSEMEVINQSNRLWVFAHWREE